MSPETFAELVEIIAGCRARHRTHGDFPEEEIELRLLRGRNGLDPDDVIALMTA